MRKETKAQLILIGITMVWGVGFPITSLALKDIGPFTLVSIRSFLASVVLFILFRKSIGKIDKGTIKGAGFIALSLVIGNVLQAAGMKYTTPSKSSFITGLTVIFVPMIMTVTHKKLPNKKVAASIVIAIMGLFLLTYNGDKGLNKGDIITLIAAFIYGFQVLLVDKFGREQDGAMLAAIELLIVGALCVPLGYLWEGYSIGYHNNMVIICILVTGLLGSGLGMLVQNKVQPVLNPANAAIIYLFEPVFGVIFSTFIGDILSIRGVFGAILIFIAMFIGGRE